MYGTVPQGSTLDVPPPGGPAKLPLTPGRIAALTIGAPVCLGLILFTAFGLVSDVGRGTISVHDAVPPGATQVSVSTAGGTLTVRTAPRGQGTLTGTAFYTLVSRNVTEQLTAHRAAFGYSCSQEFGSCGLNATLSVPASTTVSVDSGGGNVTATGITAPVTLSTDGGDLIMNKMTGTMSLDTGGGNLTATTIAAPQLTVNTSGGDLNALHLESAQVIADTGGGDLDIAFTTVPHYVKVTSDGGNVTIIVPPGTAQYNVQTTTDGGNLNPDISINSSSSNVINVNSGGGNITLEQSSP